MNRRAFTLLEVTVALAITALMAGATAGVLASMNRKREALNRFIGKNPWQCRLADRWRDDIVAATQMRIGPDFIDLIGSCGHDAITFEETGATVWVRWQVRLVGERKGLFRREVPVKTTEYGPPVTELIALGVERIHCGTYTAADAQVDEDVTLARRPQGMGEWTVFGSGVRVIVFGPENTVVMDEVILR